MAARFRNLRILILLLILLFVALDAWLTGARSTDWEEPLWVVVYPINGDDSAASRDYIRRLAEESFDDIEVFFERERRRYGIALDQPVEINLAAAITARPPAPPPRGATLAVMAWSLKMRYWAWRHRGEGPRPDIQLFVQYYDPRHYQRLPHSVGLEKGMFGIVHAFAHEKIAGSNNVVIAHELLHTLGATDKYDPATNQPYYPLGYAAPAQQPRYPQRYGEIMAGRIPLSPTRTRDPRGLEEMVIGQATALEIRWR